MQLPLKEAKKMAIPKTKHNKRLSKSFLPYINYQVIIETVIQIIMMKNHSNDLIESLKK